MPKIPTTRRYYVYTLLDENGDPFYVGKGTGQRVFNHAKEARGKCRCRKCLKIRDVWSAQGEVLAAFVFETDSEALALKEEVRLIQEIGVKNLCNQNAGMPGWSQDTPLPTIQLRGRPPQWLREALVQKQNDDQQSTP